MKKALLFAAIAGLLAISSVEADPVLRLTWDRCSGPLNRSRLSGPIATVVVTAVGFNQPVTGVDVQIGLWSGYAELPPAWRYDASGCAAGGFRNSETAAGPTCPFLSAGHLGTVSRIEYANGRASFQYANTHDAITVSPAALYTIAKFEFDQSASGVGVQPDSCGCSEQPICIHLVHASWFGADGIAHPFVVQQEFVLWEDPGGSLGCPIGCDLCDVVPPPPPNPCSSPPTPATSHSWGSLKASYR